LLNSPLSGNLNNSEGLILALSLLVLGVIADDHYVAVSLDDLALFADLLNGRLYFHSNNHLSL
jgi:hypothetical protein